MKILYITGELNCHGGIERVVTMKMNYLSSIGYDVFLSTYEQNNKPFVYPLASKVKHSDLDINYCVDDIGGSYFSWRCLKLIPKHFFRTRQLIIRLKPDIIIVPNGGFEYWFLPFVKYKARIIREFHASQYFRAHSAGLVTKLDSFAQKLYDAVVVLTPQEVDYFKFKRNLSVIPNPVVETDIKTDLTKKKVIAVGRIAPVKGFDKLIEVAALVINKHPDYIFEVWGDGDEVLQMHLNDMVKEKKLDNNVFFMGQTTEVPKKMADSSIYLCTSQTECYPLSLIEAHESGLPIVSFDCPNGPRNIISNGIDGFLVKDQSVEEAANAITKLIETDGLLKTMSQNAMRKSKQYQVESIMSMWISLFNSITNL